MVSKGFRKEGREALNPLARRNPQTLRITLAADCPEQTDVEAGGQHSFFLLSRSPRPQATKAYTLAASTQLPKPFFETAGLGTLFNLSAEQDTCEKLPLAAPT
ncbi:hypothetical protein V9T40_006307 [Parthenolecanium corni]|uniref:Uncharacterized protein n=1 Tax=Parthenolecanium corni TaxID=536013 RepID=A0AAN9Y614_9HEMI